jgi:O-antigen/teichoic acid export membrane protein
MSAEQPFALSARTLVVAAGQALVKLPQLAVAVVLVRLLTEAEWSTLSFALTIYLTGIGLGGLNIQQGVYFFFGRTPPADRRGLAIQTTALLLASAALAAGVILSLGAWVSGDQLTVAPLLPWLALLVVLEVPTSAAPMLLLAAERPKLSAAFTGGMAVLQAAALIVPTAMGHDLLSVVRWLIGYAAVRALLYGGVLAWLTPRGRLWLETSRLREQLVYTAPLALSMATSILNRFLDKWLVAGFVPESFGTYYLAAQEVPLIPILPYAMGAVVATRYVWAFKVGRPALAREYFLAASSRIALVVLPASAAVIACAPELLPLAFTEANAAAVLPFQIYSVILFHRVAEYGIVLRAAGDTRSLWMASLTLLGANVLASVPLVWLLGMEGAALGTLLANAVAWVYILRRIAATLGVSLRDVFPWRSYGQTLGAALAVGGATWALGTQLAWAPLPLLAAKVAFFALAYWGVSKGLGLQRALPPVPADDPALTRELG